jgi:hypothetical protein
VTDDRIGAAAPNDAVLAGRDQINAYPADRLRAAASIRACRASVPTITSMRMHDGLACLSG